MIFFERERAANKMARREHVPEHVCSGAGCARAAAKHTRGPMAAQSSSPSETAKSVGTVHLLGALLQLARPLCEAAERSGRSPRVVPTLPGRRRLALTAMAASQRARRGAAASLVAPEHMIPSLLMINGFSGGNNL